MDDQAFLQALESRQLPASEFNHLSHLFAAWAYRRRYNTAEAAVRCARALSRYAMAKGVAEKYHHTITMAILAILYSRLDCNPELKEDWQAFLSANNDVVMDARQVLLLHYTEEKLNKDTARRGFVAPDKQPLPTACLLH